MFYSKLWFQAQAQTISEHAIGLRFGGNNGYGAEISYQRALGSNNRLELDLGWRNDRHFNAFKFTGLYQWVWTLEGRFNWFAGFGGGLGSVDYNNGYRNGNHDGNNEFFLFGAGNIGIEYNFNIPLVIALDFRPEVGSGDYNNNLNFDIALALRYQF